MDLSLTVARSGTGDGAAALPATKRRQGRCDPHLQESGPGPSSIGGTQERRQVLLAGYPALFISGIRHNIRPSKKDSYGTWPNMLLLLENSNLQLSITENRKLLRGQC